MKIKGFFKWLYDKVINQTAYWYKEPPKWMNTERWGKNNYTTNPLTGMPMKIKKIGNPVTIKYCRICGVKVWSNNPIAICGKLSCWVDMSSNKNTVKRLKHEAISR